MDRMLETELMGSNSSHGEVALSGFFQKNV